MKKLLIMSTSTIYGSSYLDYAKSTIYEFFKVAKDITFIPFARPSGITYDEYTNSASKVFNDLGLHLKGIHEYSDMKEAAENAKAFFIGGGNTFLLLKTIYETGLFSIIQKKVEAGAPYMGTSAGSNICGKTINNTNDMPIVYPPSFEAFGFIPYNLNPHYLDPQKDLKHMGETRETRINEFHVQSDIPVIGLREGSWLAVDGDRIALKGNLNARYFEQGKAAKEFKSGHIF